MKRITEFRESVKNFKNLSGLLETLFAYSPMGLQVFDSKGYTLFVNQSFRDVFGAVPPSDYSVLNDKQAESAGVLPFIKRAFAGEMVQLPTSWYDPKQVENIHIGNRVAIETTAAPILNTDGRVAHVVFVFKDVTAEQIVREQHSEISKLLNTSTQLMNTFLKNTQALIYFKDINGKYIMVNKKWCDVFKMSTADVLSKTDHEIFDSEFADVFVKTDQSALLSESHVETEETTIHHDGTRHSYLSLKFPLRTENGEVNGIGGISTDITELKAVNLELGRSRRLESLGVLAGGIAHDFNNSLAIVQLQAEAILMADPSSKIAKDAQSIIDATTHSATLIKQLLAFGRKQEIQASSLNLKDLLESLKKILAQAVGENISLTTKYSSDTQNIFADPAQIEQILVNLCMNSRDAMPTGGSLSIEIKNTFLNDTFKNRKIGSPNGPYVEMIVKDSGLGMGSDIQERIFEPFFTTKPQGQGTGLGLASVIGIVQQNKGELILKSVVGVGTCFHLFFPANSEAATKKNLQEEVQATKSNGTTRQGPELVVLIEDHNELRSVTASTLIKNGYEVIDVENLAQLQKSLKHITRPVDLIISDIIMPGQSGPEIVKEILNYPLFKNAKILFVSGYSNNELENHQLGIPEFSFLEKPYNGKKLIEKIHSLFNKNS